MNSSSILPAVIGIGGAMMGLPTWQLALGTGIASAMSSGNLGQGLMSGLMAGGLGSLAGSVAGAEGAVDPQLLAQQAAPAAAASNTVTGIGSLGQAGGMAQSMNPAIAQAMGDYGTPLGASAAESASRSIPGTAGDAWSFGPDQTGYQQAPTPLSKWDRLVTNLPNTDFMKLMKENQMATGAAGIGTLGLSSIQQQQTNKAAYDKKMAEINSRKMGLGQYTPTRDYQSEWQSLMTSPPRNTIGTATGLGFAGGGHVKKLHPMPGFESGGGHHRSVVGALARMYASKESAIADMRNPDSPIHQLGITRADDPLLNAAFPKNKHEGMVTGQGDGLSDSIPARIGGMKDGMSGGGEVGQPAALADGEVVVPADVVSHMGNGSSNAGAKKLITMFDRVRKAKTGKIAQAKALNARKYLPA